MPHHFLFQPVMKISAGLILIGLFILPGTHGAPRPRLNLFPSDVTEHLSNTGALAKGMENSLKEVIGKLENQSKLYHEIGCEGSSDDPGCEEIANQISDNYSAMLSIMEKNLPEMKTSIEATNKGIGKNLRKELGKKTSPAQIQRLLSKQSRPKARKGRFSLSSRFAKYHKMISSGSQNSLAGLAAEIYLDSREVLRMIDLMEAEIAQQQTIMKLGKLYGTLTPKMISTVDAVKTVIFGEPDDGLSIPAAIGNDAGAFHSPLEME